MDKNDFTPEDMDLFTHSIAAVIEKQEGAYKAISALVDAAGESWFELGEKLERNRTLEILDSFEAKLVDSEEDAKMTIAILRKLINDGGQEENGAGE